MSGNACTARLCANNNRFWTRRSRSSRQPLSLVRVDPSACRLSLERSVRLRAVVEQPGTRERKRAGISPALLCG